MRREMVTDPFMRLTNLFTGEWLWRLAVRGPRHLEFVGEVLPAIILEVSLAREFGIHVRCRELGRRERAADVLDETQCLCGGEAAGNVARGHHVEQGSKHGYVPFMALCAGL